MKTPAPVATTPGEWIPAFDISSNSLLSAAIVLMVLLPPLLQARHPKMSGTQHLSTSEGRLFLMLLGAVTALFGTQWLVAGVSVRNPGMLAAFTSFLTSTERHIVVEVDPRTDKLLCAGAAALVLIVGRKAPPSSIPKDTRYLAWWLQPILWLGILGTMGSMLAFMNAFDAVPPWLVFMLDLVDGFEGIANLVCFVLFAWVLYYVAKTLL